MAGATLPSSRTNSPDELRREMRAIRRELGNDVEEVIDHAGKMVDWRYYVNRYPWATIGAAALLGYLLVPNRTTVVQPDAALVAKLLEQKTERVPEVKQPTILGSLLSMGTNLAMRAVLTYAAQQAGKMVGQQAAQGEPQEMQHG